MTQLSVNINKVATIRNARGGNMPNLVKFALDCESFGAQGITVHPRPDERHVRYADVTELRPLLTQEFNIEGNPVPKFIELVTKVKPAQVTLVPDAEDAITSNAGWDTVKHADYLRGIVAEFKRYGIRVSLFVDPIPEMIRKAAEIGADRVELYTEAYASNYAANREKAIAPYVEAAKVARECGLGLNAGHDLSLENLAYFHQQIPWCDEVSIGHALISDALYLGIEETIHQYLACLKD
ncbi:MAG: pyridoxine 5'-phosphate synthase [Paludibacteraceae bacterium]|nr:pyridoxine 5'-phosphate synthase [Paludibacteraceae bacterium]